VSQALESTRPPCRCPWLCLWLLGLVALPAIWIWADPYTLQIQHALQTNAAFKAALPFIKPLGKLDKQIVALLLVYGVGLLLRRRLAHRWLALTLGCLLATGIVVNATKLTVRRERPKYEYRLVPLDGPDARPSGNRYRSFPSADTASVFAIATVALAFVPGASVPVFLVGVLVGLSRIAVGMHHPADVWGALLMATGASALVLRRWRPRPGGRAPDEGAPGPADPGGESGSP